MAWTSPRTWVAAELVTAALFNTHIRDNEVELRGGGLSIPSQAANDFLYASSATQLGRVAAATGVPRFDGTNWSIVNLYPVGSIYINANVSTNPATLLGFGTWVAFGAGRVMVGLDAGQTEFDVAEETGGSKTHTLTTAEMPAHTHAIKRGTTGSGTATSANLATDDTVPLTESQGGGGAHNNLQPYIVVYMWKRTA